MTSKVKATPVQPDPDAHLSDHEWRLKQAAEGKAIYLPGKTVEEVLAAREARENATVTLTLTAKQAALLQRAAFDVQLVASQAENALKFFGHVISDRDYEGDVGISDALHLLGLGVGSCGVRGDFEELQRLANMLRDLEGTA